MGLWVCAWYDAPGRVCNAARKSEQVLLRGHCVGGGPRRARVQHVAVLVQQEVEEPGKAGADAEHNCEAHGLHTPVAGDGKRG